MQELKERVKKTHPSKLGARRRGVRRGKKTQDPGKKSNLGHPADPPFAQGAKGRPLTKRTVISDQISATRKQKLQDNTQVQSAQGFAKVASGASGRSV